MHVYKYIWISISRHIIHDPTAAAGAGAKFIVMSYF